MTKAHESVLDSERDVERDLKETCSLYDSVYATKLLVTVTYILHTNSFSHAKCIPTVTLDGATSARYLRLRW